MNKKGQLGLFIGIAFFILIIAVIFLIIFINGSDTPKYRPTDNITQNKTYWNITVSSNAEIKINYILENNTYVLVRGIMFPEIKENYVLGIENNTNVSLTGYSDEYYMNKTICTILREKQDCRVNLKPKALDYTITLTNTFVIIDPKNLTIQAPILICWTERSNVANVIMNFSETPVPFELKKEIDFCYKVDKDIKNTTIFPIVVHKNEFNNIQDLLLVSIIDYEKNGYSNIGMKQAGCLV